MRCRKTLLIAACALLWLSACIKDYSFEASRQEEPLPAPDSSEANFTLAGAGDCPNATAQGIYIKGEQLTASNTVELEVNVATAGAWNLSTDAVNGVSFSGSGSFSNTGVQTIVLHGSGIPADSGRYQIPVIIAASECRFDIRVDTLELPSCIIPKNVVDLKGVVILGFSDGIHSNPNGSYYEFTGISSAGDFSMKFAGNTYPEAGVYRIQPEGGSFVRGDVIVNINSQNIHWKSSIGWVFITINNGKLTAVFCYVKFSATFNGYEFVNLGSANVSEL